MPPFLKFSISGLGGRWTCSSRRVRAKTVGRARSDVGFSFCLGREKGEGIMVGGMLRSTSGSRLCTCVSGSFSSVAVPLLRAWSDFARCVETPASAESSAAEWDRMGCYRARAISRTTAQRQGGRWRTQGWPRTELAVTPRCRRDEQRGCAQAPTRRAARLARRAARSRAGAYETSSERRCICASCACSRASSRCKGSPG